MSDKIIDMKGVTVSFDGFKVLDNLDFSIGYGELRFLIGPNGAGKSTLLDIMTAKTRPNNGRVTFDGKHNVARLSEHKLVRHGLGRKFQTPSVFGSLNVFENLEAAIGFNEPIFRLGGKLPALQQTKAEEVLEIIGLKDHAKTPAGILAHGQKHGWRSGCCWYRSRSCCCWTNRWRG